MLKGSGFSEAIQGHKIIELSDTTNQLQNSCMR